MSNIFIKILTGIITRVPNSMKFSTQFFVCWFTLIVCRCSICRGLVGPGDLQTHVRNHQRSSTVTGHPGLPAIVQQGPRMPNGHPGLLAIVQQGPRMPFGVQPSQTQAPSQRGPFPSHLGSDQRFPRNPQSPRIQPLRSAAREAAGRRMVAMRREEEMRRERRAQWMASLSGLGWADDFDILP